MMTSYGRNRLIAALGMLVAAMSAFGVPFERINLYQEIQVDAIETINDTMKSTNGTTIIMSGNQTTNPPPEKLEFNGIKFEVLDDGFINFILHEDDTFGQSNIFGEPMERIFINDKTLKTCIEEVVEQAKDKCTMEVVSNLVQ